MKPIRSNGNEHRPAPQAPGALRHAIFGAALLVLSWVAAIPATAATCTWKGPGTDWNTATNWSGHVVPANGDAVVIPNITAKPYMPSGTYPTNGGAFLSFDILAGATTYCLGDTNAVNAPSGGSAGTKHGAGVTINCQSATILGTLSADALGFPGGGQSGNGYNGPGGGRSGFAGGSYGGGITCGSLTNPTALGSGGLNYAPGGGAIKLVVVNTLTVNGSITAKGGEFSSQGGSGGSVWLVCHQLAGTGMIGAVGGAPSGPTYPSGCGGRIAIECQSNAFQGTIRVGSAGDTKAQAGTLWFPKWFAGREGTRGNPTDFWLPGSEFGVRYYFADSTVTQYWNVYMTNSWLELYSGSVAISNFAATDSYIYFPSATLAMSNLSVYGNMVLANSTVYMLPYGVYNMAGDFTMADTGTVVYAIGDTNAINKDSGGTNGGPHGIGLSISCANAIVAGTINAIGQGFPCAAGPGKGADSGTWVGGSYGGRGGGTTYGCMARPTALGSGEGVLVGGGTGAGGGAVKIKASGTLALNGTIDASGTVRSGEGASGGSVWLMAGTLNGRGRIMANGADGSSGGYGSGGGGRIAIEYGTWNYTGTHTVDAGSPQATLYAAKNGTMYLCQSPWLGTTSSNGVNGRRLDTQFSVDNNSVRIVRSITRFDTSLQWSDYSTTFSTNGVVTNIAIYTISGLRPSRGYFVHVDGTNQYGRLYASTNGVLTFTNTLDRLHNFFVTPYERGVIIKICGI